MHCSLCSLLPQLLELTQPQEFSNLIEPLFYRIAQCLMSQHFQVRALQSSCSAVEFLLVGMSDRMHVP